MVDSKQRFTERVADYTRCRPGYPPEILRALREDCVLGAGCAVADIGSGTGKFSEILLQDGHRVFAVEPNDAMRAAAEAALGGRKEFTSIAGSAEATNLPARCADLITVAQAFHWFDAAKTRAEFMRILKPRGWVALIWNERRHDSPFLRAYEQLVRKFGTDYATLEDRGITSESLARFFASGSMVLREHLHEQVFDWEGLAGRLLSCSYAPKEGQPNHAPMMRELEQIFAAGQAGGRVTMGYTTFVYLGRLDT